MRFTVTGNSDFSFILTGGKGKHSGWCVREQDISAELQYGSVLSHFTFIKKCQLLRCGYCAHYCDYDEFCSPLMICKNVALYVWLLWRTTWVKGGKARVHALSAVEAQGKANRSHLRCYWFISLDANAVLCLPADSYSTPLIFESSRDEAITASAPTCFVGRACVSALSCVLSKSRVCCLLCSPP